MLPTGILICCTGPFWSGFLCLFGFCLPSLRCLISALTQAGGGGLLFSFTSSVQSCYGEGGALQTDRCVWGALTVFRPHGACPAQGCLCFPCLHCPGSRLLYRERALRCMQFQFSSTPQKRGFGCTCVLCLPGLSSSGSQELEGRTLPGCSAPSRLRGPSLSFCACQSGASGLSLFSGAGL